MVTCELNRLNRLSRGAKNEGRAQTKFNLERTQSFCKKKTPPGLSLQKKSISVKIFFGLFTTLVGDAK